MLLPSCCCRPVHVLPACRRCPYSIYTTGGALARAYSCGGSPGVSPVGGSSPSRCAFSIIDVITYLFTDRPAFFAHFCRLFLFAGLFFCIFTDTISSALSSYFLFARFFASDMDICFTALHALVTGINNPLIYTGYRCFFVVAPLFFIFFQVACFVHGFLHWLQVYYSHNNRTAHSPTATAPRCYTLTAEQLHRLSILLHGLSMDNVN